MRYVAGYQWIRDLMQNRNQLEQTLLKHEVNGFPSCGGFAQELFKCKHPRSNFEGSTYKPGIRCRSSFA